MEIINGSDASEVRRMTYFVMTVSLSGSGKTRYNQFEKDGIIPETCEALR
jgi:hypothetical protein